MLKKAIYTLSFVIMSINVIIGQPVESNQETVSLDIEIRKITPPNLERNNLGKRITCYRPVRKNGALMNVINGPDNKIVANNYGHGGSGWTLAPGACKYVTSILQDKLNKNKIKKKEPILVIGGGILGLFHAFELLQRNYTDITIVAESFKNLASHNAGGLLGPLDLYTPPDMEEIMEKIKIDSALFYKNIALNKNLDFNEGAKIMPFYIHTNEHSSMEQYVKHNIMQPPKKVLVDFQNGTQYQMCVYDDAIFIEVDKMMRMLMKKLKEKGVKFKQQTVYSISDLQEKVIVNCIGNGTIELLDDANMVPTQGHLILLENQNPSNINYMLFSPVSPSETITDAGFSIERNFYIFPKSKENSDIESIGVIGGTYISGATANTPHEQEFEIIYQNARNFYGLK